MAIMKNFTLAALLSSATLVGCSGEDINPITIEKATEATSEVNILRTYTLPDSEIKIIEAISPHDKNRVCLFAGHGRAIQCFNNVSLSSTQPEILASYKLQGNSGLVVEFSPGFNKDIHCTATKGYYGHSHHYALNCS